MEAFLHSFFLVALAEMGDRTQLLGLFLAAKYKRPVVILSGVLVATFLNHALASGLGIWFDRLISVEVLRWVLGLSFLVFSVWILIPDKEEAPPALKTKSLLGLTIIAFFVAEMGDKTQIATIGLAASYGDFWMVTLGSTFGLLLSVGLAVLCGQKISQKLPMQWIRIFAATLFAAFGALILLGRM